MTRVHVKLLGPCSKMGRMGYRPTRRQLSHTTQKICQLPARCSNTARYKSGTALLHLTFRLSLRCLVRLKSKNFIVPQ